MNFNHPEVPESSSNSFFFSVDIIFQLLHRNRIFLVLGGGAPVLLNEIDASYYDEILLRLLLSHHCDWGILPPLSAFPSP